MGLFDTSQPGFASGLMGGKYSADAGRESDIRKALLMASFGMLQGRGWQGVGNAGLAAMGTMDRSQDNRRRDALADFQMQQAQQQAAWQAADRARQERRDALPGQFMTPPTLPATMDSRDVGQPGEPTLTPGFNMPGYIQALMSVDPAQALQLQAATAAKTPQPIKLGEGDQLLDPSTYRPVASNPKAATPEKLPEALRTLEMIHGKGTPAYLLAVQELSKKMTSHQPATQVSYGAPVAGVDASGNPVFFQPPTKGAEQPRILGGVRPPPKDIPASTREKIADNSIALQKINDALSLLGEKPDALGVKNYAPDAIVQRLDPSGVELRAAVADIGSQKIHDRSGAAVTAAEAPRLKPFVPLATDAPETVKTKLKRFKAEYEAMNRELQAGAGIRQAAAKPKASAPAASAGSAGDGWSITPVGP